MRRTNIFALIALAVFIGFLLVGCQWFNQAFNLSGKSYCDDPAFAENSLICKVFSRYGVQPEAVNGLLLDAAAIEAIVEPEHVPVMCGILEKMGSYYVQPGEKVWDELLSKFILDRSDLTPEQGRLIAGVITRRVPVLEFDVPQVISAEDDVLLRAAYKSHRGNLGCAAFD